MFRGGGVGGQWQGEEVTWVCSFGHGWAAAPGILPEASGTKAFP